MQRRIVTNGVRLAFALAVALVSIAGRSGTAAAAPRAKGVVYVQTNAASGNAVVRFERANDGTLTRVGEVATGGSGTGSGLGSQGALALSQDRHYLFAVDAGSNDIASFAFTRDGVRLIGRVASGGVQPISLTTNDDRLYVLNAGGAGNISGFDIDDDGALVPIAGSTQPLSQANAGPAEVQFSPDGDQLVVTEKAANALVVYPVDDGVAQSGHVQPAAGTTPFGFAFTRRGQLIVSEAFGGATGAGAVSSYTLDDGDVQVISGSVANHQSAPCWIAVTKNGRYAYAANTGSGTISAYRIERHGALALLNANGVTATTGAGSKPADLDFSHDDRYLYVLNGGNGTIGVFATQHDGSLSALTNASGLPAGAAGLVAE